MSCLNKNPEATIVARQRKLMATARQYADSIQSQPGVVGIVLYGSLALGAPAELTQFSDVDLAVILDRDLPTHFAEHRLVDGIKLDVTLIHMGWLREQVAKPPEGLDPGGWVHNVLIKSLLLENAETILFDPTGEIAQTRRKLNELTTYPAMAVAGTQRWLRHVEKQCLASAREQWQRGSVAAFARRWINAAVRCGRMNWIAENPTMHY
jgi:predicted nucleotidyltransferase